LKTFQEFKIKYNENKSKYNEVNFDRILERDYSKTGLTILSEYDCLMFLIFRNSRLMFLFFSQI